MIWDTGEVPFFTYVHRTWTFSITRYDAFVYGTAYLIGPTKSNDPTAGLLEASPTSANERKLQFEDGDGDRLKRVALLAKGMAWHYVSS